MSFRFTELKNRCESTRGSFGTSTPARPRYGLPKPGIAADGSLSCGGSVLEKPSLTRMIDLRPSRMPPILIAAPLSALSVTSVRISSTVAVG